MSFNQRVESFIAVLLVYIYKCKNNLNHTEEEKQVIDMLMSNENNEAERDRLKHFCTCLMLDSDLMETEVRRPPTIQFNSVAFSSLTNRLNHQQ